MRPLYPKETRCGDPACWWNEPTTVCRCGRDKLPKLWTKRQPVLTTQINPGHDFATAADRLSRHKGVK